jgi:DNA-nicking Smr family endonuclease
MFDSNANRGVAPALTIRTAGSFQPFRELARLLGSKPGPRALQEEKPAFPTPTEKQALQRWGDRRTMAPAPTAADNDSRLFWEAMADVVPIGPANRAEHQVYFPAAAADEQTPDAEGVIRLLDLVNSGKGFIVEQTPEYVQGTGPGSHPHWARRLHRGDFALQAHIDLHGLCVPQAEQVLGEFFKKSIGDGRRCLLVVHGRGRCSSDEPILKNYFQRWLTSGPWRKWVLAFASARGFDGGTGATYVLLRRRPLSHRLVKSYSKNPPNNY